MSKPKTASACNTVACNTIVQLLVLCLLPVTAHSERLCFTFAETYYEQLYCEIKAQGKGNNLPALYEFQRNNALTQALLLKRPAGAIGVKLEMPKADKTSTRIKRRSKPAINLTDRHTVKLLDNKSGAQTQSKQTQQQSQDNSGLHQCTTEGTVIRCSRQSYKLVGNRSNKQLGPGVFNQDNKMNMPVYRGALSDVESVERYLQQSYTHYLQKMLSIGLGGSTLSYGKFSYLFDDLNQKNISFSDRFEKMYYYLKQDKQRMAVNTNVTSPASLTMDNCYALHKMMVCSTNNKNYIYLSSDG